MKVILISGFVGILAGAVGSYFLFPREVRTEISAAFQNNSQQERLGKNLKSLNSSKEGQKLPPSISDFDVEKDLIQPLNKLDINSVITESTYSDWYPRLESLIAENAHGCADAVNLIKNKELRESALNQVLYYWGKQDYEAAKNWGNAALTKNELLLFTDSLFGGLIAANPEAAKSEVLNLESPFIKQRLAASLASALFVSDPASAEAWVLQSLAPTQAASIFSSFGSMMISRGNIDGAVEILSKIPYGDARNSLLESIGNAYGKGDHLVALRWLTTLDKVDRAAAEPSVVFSWALADPQRAAEYAAFSPAASNGSIEAAIGSWSNSSPLAAIQWIETNLPQDEPAFKLMTVAIQQWGRMDPSAAAKYIATMDSEVDRSHLLQLVTSSWMGRDPLEAGNFLLSMGDNDAIYSIELLVKGWSRLDSLAASEWVSSLKQGVRYDVASAGLAESIMLTDPLGAARWANSIGDTNKRQKALTTVFSRFGSQDQEAAISALKILGLSPLDQKIAQKAILKSKGNSNN
jgi:hypothetical protein